MDTSVLDRDPKPGNIDYEQLDPGIREVVRLLRDNGFATTDSGDGAAKVGVMECALPYPNVFCAVAPEQLVTEAERLRMVVEAEGVPISAPGPDAAGAPSIEASFEPVSGKGVLALLGLDDARLSEARTRHVRREKLARLGQLAYEHRFPWQSRQVPWRDLSPDEREGWDRAAKAVARAIASDQALVDAVRGLSLTGEPPA